MLGKRLELLGPGITACMGRLQLTSGGVLPAFTRQCPKGRRCLTIHHHHGVVKRWIRVTRLGSPRIFGAMLARVPTSRGKIDTAAERDAIVDDNDLLVVTCGHRMGVVVAN